MKQSQSLCWFVRVRVLYVGSRRSRYCTRSNPYNNCNVIDAMCGTRTPTVFDDDGE